MNNQKKLREKIFKENKNEADWMKAIKLAKERGEWSDHPTGDYVYEKPEEGTWPP